MRVAVAGTGSAGRRHIANLLAAGIRDVCAVSTVARHDRLVIDGSEVEAVPDLARALPRVDAVVIANPTSLHLEYMRACVSAGKHVYVEKPAAASAEGLSELVAEAVRKRLVIAVGTQFRFNDRLQDVKAILGRGELGEVLSVRAYLGEHVADYHPGEDYRQSYTTRAALGGGVLLTQIHQIDYLNWLFGPFESVFAVGRAGPVLPIDVEDTADYLLRARSGAAVGGHLDYLQRPKTVGMEVWGTAGRCHWDYLGNSLRIVPGNTGAPASLIETPFDRNAMFRSCLDDFLRCIRSGGRPRADLGDGLEALGIVDAIKASISTRQAVKLS